MPFWIPPHNPVGIRLRLNIHTMAWWYFWNINWFFSFWYFPPLPPVSPIPAHSLTSLQADSLLDSLPQERADSVLGRDERSIDLSRKGDPIQVQDIKEITTSQRETVPKVLNFPSGQILTQRSIWNYRNFPSDLLEWPMVFLSQEPETHWVSETLLSWSK